MQDACIVSKRTVGAEKEGKTVAILPIPFSKYIKQKKTRSGGRYESKKGGEGGVRIETTKYIANGNETKH